MPSERAELAYPFWYEAARNLQAASRDSTHEHAGRGRVIAERLVQCGEHVRQRVNRC